VTVAPTVDVLDVAILGGGPAGSVCAARLASKGRRVVVLERGRHPRFHLGESLLPDSLGVLDAIGVLDEVRRRFLVKRGARFVDGRLEGRVARYAFRDAFHARWDHAFQVPRDDFDELLFRHAATCGAELREGTRAQRVVPGDAPGQPALVEALGADGVTQTLAARFVVDATGRDALLARAAGDVERIAHLDRTALYTQVRGAWRDEGDREGDIQIVVFGEEAQRGWLWLIPFRDGRTSVGAVVSNAMVRAHGGDAATLFDAALREAPVAAHMLEGSERLFPPRAATDFSFHVRRVRGSGWLAVGDAAGFIDPLFSTGVHLALTGALRAADTIDQALAADDLSESRFERWETELRAGTDLFLGAVQAFYAGDLEAYLFADPQRPFLRRAITSLLAGDVFDPDRRWADDVRARFPVR
jgi:flavin-dependent dehydrogenase